jgi:hypothetical protein
MIPLPAARKYMGLDVVHTVACNMKISGGWPRLGMAVVRATDGCEHEK